jgi:dTDP-4-amino-4,6-dideoxygalactose transaminase
VTRIPLVDLSAQYHAHREQFDAALARCIASSSFIGGPDHKAFAQEFAEFCGGGHVALCGNGTDALYLTFAELLGPGDGDGEVITVSHTFVATAEAITQAGYRPVFVDVDPDTCLMDVSLIEEAITPRTQAIVPVHLYGQMVPMDRVMEIAQRHDLPVIEDAAQAHGAAWQGKAPGQWGDAACFSFYPAKNLGAWGDGGAIFTRDQDLAERIQMRANHGRKAKYEHEFVGSNSRLDGVQAAILRVKLRYLPKWNEDRRRIAAWYREGLADHNGVQLPTVLGDAVPVFHLYVVQLEERDRVLERLRGEGVGAGIHYPIPVHEQPAYSHLGMAPESLPVTHNLSGRVLSLPIYPEMSPAQVETVVSIVGSDLQTGPGCR